ncbi:MAG: pirin family protein [Candidatus Paceibacterota bacterium]
MKTVLHKATKRGHAEHGWLITNHSFSFAGFYDPARMGFGVLRVLNDDTILPHNGFGTHPHDNMEIITIPLSGTLTHEDSLGHAKTLSANEVQVMSAGSGLAHSEKNESDEPLSLLQLWIESEKENSDPRYDQKAFLPQDRANTWQCIVSPLSKKQSLLTIAQRAFIYWGEFDPQDTTYTLQNPQNGVYVFVIDGEVQIENEILGSRDALAVTETSQIPLRCITRSFILCIEVPQK